MKFRDDIPMSEIEHTKECQYRMNNDLPHTNCYCKCHKIIMADSKKMESRTF